MADQPCAFCGYGIPSAWSLCPHCARPSLYPNVRAAEAERQRITERYDVATASAAARGCRTSIVEFELVAESSKAVLARPLGEADRLASSHRQLYSTFYKLVEAELRLPDDDKWDRLRRLADETLFPGYKEEIRFAALSVSGIGLIKYGEVSLVLRNDMIAHRASVFEDNSAVFLEKHTYNPPLGSRAVWEDRAKLCVAKLGDRISPNTPKEEFADVLLSQGKSFGDEGFIEVHVWGPMSSRTFEHAIVSGFSSKSRNAFVKALQEKFRQVGVTLEVAKRTL
jgi:hypothetical protein